MNNIKELPKINVSFQDQFCACPDELTSTVKYIAQKLLDLGISPTVGLKMLLWEEDVDEKNNKYFLCNIGEVIRLSQNIIRNYSAEEIPDFDYFKINGTTVAIRINRNEYFKLNEID